VDTANLVYMLVSVRNVCIVVCVLIISFFSHRLFQRLYFEYCMANIFVVYLFKNSNFCVILEDAIGIFELVFRKILL